MIASRVALASEEKLDAIGLAHRRRWRSVGLFTAKSIFQASDSILNFPSNLVALSFGLQLRVPSNFADNFLHGALRLLRRAFDPIPCPYVLSFGEAFFGGTENNPCPNETFRR
jgi:hypothetical protein